MARKIKETPVLTGKAAKRFSAQIKANETRPVSKEAYTRAMNTYHRIIKASNLK